MPKRSNSIRLTQPRSIIEAWRTTIRPTTRTLSRTLTPLSGSIPNSADAFTGRCAARAEAGTIWKRALADCNHSLAIRANDPLALNSRGFTYLRLDQFDSAIADYNAALKIDPKLASALYGRGLAKQKKGDSAGGKSIWRRPICCKPTLPRSLPAMA